MPRQALIVLTSQEKLGETGRSTGAYMSEIVDAWEVFTAAGYAVDLVSVRGGRPPLEAVAAGDPRHRRFLDDPEMSRKLSGTPRPDQVRAAEYGIVFLAGGHGAVWDLPHDRALADLVRRVYENDGVVSAVCHGPAGLLNVTLSDGSPLVAGRQVACFTDDEERAVGMTGVVPFLLSGALSARGAVHDSRPSFLPHVTVDGRLVTGQNPASATLVAARAVEVGSGAVPGRP